jgi:hypothetical protein
MVAPDDISIKIHVIHSEWCLLQDIAPEFSILMLLRFLDAFFPPTNFIGRFVCSCLVAFASVRANSSSVVVSRLPPTGEDRKDATRMQEGQPRESEIILG